MSENVIFQNPVPPPSSSVPPPQSAAIPTEAPSPPPPQSIPPAAIPGGGGRFPTIHFSKKLLFGGIGIIVLIIVILIFLASSLKKTIDGKATITVWGLWEDNTVMQPVIADFEKQNPNITVQYIKQDPNQYSDRILARIQNGLGPDVFEYHNTWIPMLQPVLLPLSSDVITKDDFKKTFYPVANQDLINNGAIYGIPNEIDTLALFVNTDILQAGGVTIPTTWDQVGTTARKLTVKDENNKIKTAGIALGTYDNITHASDVLSLLLLQNGVNLKDIKSSSQNAIGALNYYKSFASDPSTSVWDQSMNESIKEFAGGRLAMYFGFSWDVFTIKGLNPNLNFKINPAPHLENRNITVGSYWVNGVSVKSKHQKEALQFLKFISQKDSEQKIYSEESKTRLFGEPYARIDLADSVKNNPYVGPIVSQAPYSMSSFFASDTGSSGINAQMNGYLGNAVRGLFNNISTDTAVNTLSDGVNQVLQQYGAK